LDSNFTDFFGDGRSRLYSKTVRSIVGVKVRKLEAKAAQTTNFSIRDVHTKADILSRNFNLWLKSPQFSHVREELVAHLNENDEVRFMLQTSNIQVRQLPWHLWDILERYRNAEVSISAPNYRQVISPKTSKNQVNILAILGDNTGINVEKDRAILNSIPNSKTHFLVKPERKQLNDQLWEQPWDILFFAGHSRTEGETGIIYINDTDSLNIGELRYALKKAIASGLQLAIFNSCDGLGLAQELAELNIPQIVVMREPVPDEVAQEFLKYFIRFFASGKSFYLAVREARERLQGLESHFPYASWLPVICQNPAESPVSWQELSGIYNQSSQQQVQPKSNPKPTEQFVSVSNYFDNNEDIPFFQGMIGQSRLIIKYCDLTTLTADVIVSSDDTNFSMGGGVSKAILMAGGEKIWEEVRLKAPVGLGEIAITQAGYLKAQKIFHAAVLDRYQPELTNISLIQKVTKKCLQACDRLELHSIALPALATGAARLSPEESAFAMLSEIADHLRGSTSIALVIIVLYARPNLPSNTLSRFHDQVTKFMKNYKN